MRGWMAGVTVLLAATTFGCAGEALEGSWEHEDASSEIKDEMTIDENGGKREISFPYPLTCDDETVVPTISFELDVQWKGDADAGYDLELECITASITGTGGCNPVAGCGAVAEVLGFAVEFELECDMNDAEDELDCEYEGGEGESQKFDRTGE